MAEYGNGSNLIGAVSQSRPSVRSRAAIRRIGKLPTGVPLIAAINGHVHQESETTRENPVIKKALAASPNYQFAKLRNKQFGKRVKGK